MKHILFPTDFSESSLNALRYAVQFAKEYNATIDIWTIFQLTSMDAANLPPTYLEELIKTKRESLEAQMAVFIKDTPKDVIGQSSLHYGIDVSYEICKLAEKYDYIIMATQGERSMIEKWLGTITTQVLKHSPCPVLIIPKNAKFVKDYKIIYATNFEPGEEYILKNLEKFSEFVHCKVELFHVDKPNENEKNESLENPNFEHLGKIHRISNENTVEGIFQYLEKNKPAVLSLYMPQRGFFNDLLHKSVSKEITFNINEPVLGFC